MLIAGTKYKSTMFAIQIIWLLPLYFYFDQIASIICQTVTLTPMGSLASGRKLQFRNPPPPVNFIGAILLVDAAKAETGQFINLFGPIAKRAFCLITSLEGI